MVLYFAYGSNMDKEDLDRWCREKGFSRIRFLSATSAELRGYRLAFNCFSRERKSGAANIMRDPEKSVHGLLIELVDEDFEKIRKKEGFPDFYGEIEVDVNISGAGEVLKARTFKVREKAESPEFQPPTEFYLGLIKKSAEKYGFPPEYRSFLETVRTRE